MKSRILSAIIILTMIIGLLPMSCVVAASTTITITADKTNVEPGNEITYTVSLQSASNIGSATLELNIPEGLTYVSASGTFNSSVKAAIEGKDSDNFADFYEKSKTIGILDLYGNDFTNNTEIATFKCTVDENTTGTRTVDFKNATVADENDVQLQTTINPVAVSVASATINPTGISLNKTTITIEKGKKATLKATVEPEEATNKTVEWVSSDTSIATVNDEGKVTAINKGTTTITAKTVNNHTADCIVTVSNPVKNIFIKKNGSVCKSESIDKEEQITLTAEVNPEDADDRTVTWTSSEPNVASVNDGIVKGLSKGTTIITAKTSNGTEATCTVTVGIGIKSISLNETAKTIRNGDNYTFIVTYNPEETDVDKKINWSSSNPQVATVDDNGKVTVYSCTGTATITATLNADNTKTASATITAAHKSEELILHEAKTATCIAEGNKSYYTCSGCEDWYEDSTGRAKISDKESVVIPIDNEAHDWNEGITTKEPTCTEKGEKTYTCKHDSSHTKTESISAKGHTMKKTNAKAETCEEDGNIDYYTCSVCNKIFKDETGSAEITQEQTVVKAKGHDWGEWNVTTPATTETEGKETRICKYDSSHTETRTIPKLHKHELTKTEAKEATCIAEGNKEYWRCSICNKTFSDSEGKTELENVIIPIDNEAHDWNEGITTKEPTCTEKGEKTYTCKRDNSHTKTETISAKGHTTTKVDAVKPTCEKEGNKEYYKCSVCDRYFEDSTATTEITDKSSVIISALGHEFDEGKVTKEATCTEDGTKTYTCKHDSSHTRTEVIPAEHKLTKIDAKDATCIAEGNIDYWECSICHKKFGSEQATTEITDVTLPINSEAHDWDEWKVTKEATVDEEGSKTRICKLDDKHTETVEIGKIPYTIEKGNGQTHYYDENNGIEIKANGSLDKLVRLLVDGTIELNENDFNLKSGSTIVTLKPDFLDTLSEGEHTLTFEYTDGTIDASFNVAKVNIPTEDNTSDENSEIEQQKTDTTTTTEKNSSPKTGDNIFIWISLLATSIIGIFIINKLIKKKK